MILNFVYVRYELANKGLQLKEVGDFGKENRLPPLNHQFLIGAVTLKSISIFCSACLNYNTICIHKKALF
jgi:hypothetical protein